jgi:hypothetical protein
MARTNTSVYGIFKDEETARFGFDALRAKGFRETDISILHPENPGTKDFAHEKHTKAPEGAVATASLLGVIGAGLGYLVGAGSFIVPGLEQVATAGPVVAALSGLGAGLAGGGILGAIGGATIPEYEAKRYQGRVRRGGILVSVHCDNPDWTKMAVNVLRSSGAVDISTGAEAKADFAKGEKPAPRSSSRMPHTP